MSRILIDVNDVQVKELAALAEREQRSRAAVVREAIGAYLAQRQQAPERNVFGLWQRRGVDGLSYQQELRSEW
ncbi:MAG: ribbon-helix-helix domain-containing protein [Burkholderiaceae bacterium]|nr:ribbon-helix-helix domain-containing protein [Burkholderiaceae bacterium]